MDTVAGIFTAHDDARRAVNDLRALGVPAERVTLLLPGASERDLAAVPTTDAEPPGVGRAIGGVVGAATGAGGGVGAAALIGAALPGVGPVLILGALGAALFGVGGAVAGGALDHALREGLPHDELYVYEAALREGRAVVIAVLPDEAAAKRARATLGRAGAESVDAARERWWVGLRDAEAAQYGGDFGRDEPAYRRGFEAALAPWCHGRRWDEVHDTLRRRYGDASESQAFRRGYERGAARVAGAPDAGQGRAA